MITGLETHIKEHFYDMFVKYCNIICHNLTANLKFWTKLSKIPILGILLKINSDLRKNKYSFNRRIVTDGVGCSIPYFLLEMINTKLIKYHILHLLQNHLDSPMTSTLMIYPEKSRIKWQKIYKMGLKHMQQMIREILQKN